MPGLESFAGSWMAGLTWCTRCGPNTPRRLTAMALGYSLTARTRPCLWEGRVRTIDQRAGIWPITLNNQHATPCAELIPLALFSARADRPPLLLRVPEKVFITWLWGVKSRVLQCDYGAITSSSKTLRPKLLLLVSSSLRVNLFLSWFPSQEFAEPITVHSHATSNRDAESQFEGTVRLFS